jgi:hypothetical protein
MEKETRQRHTLAFVAVAILGSPSNVPAQGPPAGFGVGNVGVTTPDSRPMILERRFLASTRWEFHYSLKDMPLVLQELAVRFAGRSAVGPGEPFNTGDVLRYAASAQHLYTAANPELVVVVWHQGSFNGPVTRALIYDRIERDACRYDFGKTYAIVSLETELKTLLKYKDSPGTGCTYLAADSF